MKLEVMEKDGFNKKSMRTKTITGTAPVFVLCTHKLMKLCRYLQDPDL